MNLEKADIALHCKAIIYSQGNVRPLKIQGLLETQEVLDRAEISRPQFRDWIRRGILPKPEKRVALGQGNGTFCYFGPGIVDQIRAAQKQIAQGARLADIPPASAEESTWWHRGYKVQHSIDELVVLIERRVGGTAPAEIRTIIERFRACKQPSNRGWLWDAPLAPVGFVKFPRACDVDDFIGFFSWVSETVESGVTVSTIIGWLETGEALSEATDEARGIELELEIRGKSVKDDERAGLEDRLKRLERQIAALDNGIRADVPASVVKAANRVTRITALSPGAPGSAIGTLQLFNTQRVQIKIGNERGSRRAAGVHSKGKS